MSAPSHIRQPSTQGPPWPSSPRNESARAYWGRGIREVLWNAPTEVAGGPHYAQNNDVLTESDCDRTVTSASEFISACQSSSFERIWIGGPINIGSNAFNVRNITIAGDRGQNGSRGPLIFTNSTARHYRSGRYDHMRVVDSNVKFTGVRLRGPAHNNWSNPEYPGFFPVNDSSRFHNVTQGVRIQFGCHAEFENVECFGWGVQSVGVGYARMSRASDATCEIHHSDFHDDAVMSLGYAFTVYQGHCHAHHNFFDGHRHSVNGYGPAESEYTVEHNIFGPNHVQHVIDMHNVSDNSSNYSNNTSSRIWRYRAGGNCTIRYNTFCTANAIHGSELTSSMTVVGNLLYLVSWRGEPHPGTSVRIHNNRIMQPGPQTGNTGTSGTIRRWSQDAFVQGIYTSAISTDSRGFSRINFFDNQYGAWHGGQDYRAGYGAPYNLDGDTPTPTAQLRVYARDAESGAPINDASVTIDYLDADSDGGN